MLVDVWYGWRVGMMEGGGVWYGLVGGWDGNIYKKSAGDFLSPALRGRLPTLPLAQYHRRDQV